MYLFKHSHQGDLSAALTQGQKCSWFSSVTESAGLFHHWCWILCDNQGKNKIKIGGQWPGSEFREKGKNLMFIKYLVRGQQQGKPFPLIFILGKIKCDIGQVTESLFLKKLPVKSRCIKNELPHITLWSVCKFFCHISHAYHVEIFLSNSLIPYLKDALNFVKWINKCMSNFKEKGMIDEALSCGEYKWLFF